MSGHYRKEKNCLNCGRHVEFHYCSSCGQPNLELREPFWHFIGHSIAHYFHFESKFFQTLVPLLTKPGQLTLDYLAGKRARYIHPVSLYIFVSIVYFLIVPHVLEDKEHEQVKRAQDLNTTLIEKRKTDEKKTKALKQVTENKRQLDMVPGLSAKITEAIKPVYLIDLDDFDDLPYKEQNNYLDSVIKRNNQKPSPNTTERIKEYQEANTVKHDSTYVSYVSRQKALPAAKQDHWFLQKLKRLDYGISGKTKNHNYVNEEFKKYKPKQYFLLMPLLAFFIMINFRKNKIYYINHLVFTIHGMTAFFIISIVAEPIKKYIFGLDSWMSNLISFAVFCGIVWYLYYGLKLFYNRSKWQTMRKMISLSILYGIALFLSEGIIKGVIIYLMP
jgi:hypothetical protein